MFAVNPFRAGLPPGKAQTARGPIAKDARFGHMQILETERPVESQLEAEPGRSCLRRPQGRGILAESDPFGTGGPARAQGGGIYTGGQCLIAREGAGNRQGRQAQ